MVSAATRTTQHRRLASEQEKSKRCRYGKIEFRDREPIPELNFPGRRDAAITQMEKLIIKKSRPYYSEAKCCYLTREDLLHFGRIGVLNAHARFNKSKGVKFPSYCECWMHAIIRRSLNMEKRGTAAFGERIAYKAYKNAIDAYKRGRGTASLTVREKELFRSLKSGRLKLAKAESMLHERELALLNATRRPLSLDAPLDRRGNSSLLEEMVPSQNGAVNETASDFEILKKRILVHLAEILIKRWEEKHSDYLAKRDHAIFWGRIMRDKEDRITMKALGKKFGVSRERIRQVESMLKRDFYERIKSDPFVREMAAEHYGISIRA